MKCEHDMKEVSRGFMINNQDGGYSPTILKCTKCKQLFAVYIANPDIIIPIQTKEPGEGIKKDNMFYNEERKK